MWERDLDEVFSVFESGIGLDVFLFDRTSEVGELSLCSSTSDLSKLIWKLCRSGSYTSESAGNARIHFVSLDLLRKKSKR